MPHSCTEGCDGGLKVLQGRGAKPCEKVHSLENGPSEGRFTLQTEGLPLPC